MREAGFEMRHRPLRLPHLASRRAAEPQLAMLVQLHDGRGRQALRNEGVRQQATRHQCEAEGCDRRVSSHRSGTRMGIGPGGFEPPFPDPKSGVLPLDEGPVTMWRLNLATDSTWREPRTLPFLCR